MFISGSCLIVEVDAAICNPVNVQSLVVEEPFKFSFFRYMMVVLILFH